MSAGRGEQWTPSSYDRLILSEAPVLYLAMSTPEAGLEPDRTGRARSGTYLPAGSIPASAVLPNGDPCARFDGKAQYLEVPDADDLSVTTTRKLTIEAWMRPDALEFPAKEATGYVHWMGKGESGQQEYVLRMYALTNTEVPARPNRISGYAFNLSGGLGSGAYFQDPVTVGEWIHVVVVFNLDEVPTGTPPGSVKIYKNGTLRGVTPLRQFQVIPGNGTAPFRVATRDRHSFFLGAIAKVAVYDRELTAAQILSHHDAMVQ
jgi:concanavalin A-like lectin/glucanase superfamily protein